VTRRQGGRGAESLRDAFSAANLRKVLGLTDTGRALLARVEALRNETPVEHDGRDVLVRVVDVLAGLPMVARLHVPMNLLWRKPRAGETLAVVVPADANAPGGPIALYGDAGGSGAVPPWFDDKAGLYVAETVRVESSAGDVEVEVTGGRQVKLGAAATKRVNREGDALEPGTLSVTTGPPVTVGPITTTPVLFTYTPPTGAPQVVTLAIAGAGVTVTVTPPTSITLGGRTGPGSSKVRAED
jgi:hypothetical protein